MQILIVKRKSHLFFFENLVNSAEVELYSEDPELISLSKSRFKKSVLLPHQIELFVEQIGAENCQVLIPLDTSNCFNSWYSDPILRSLPSIGLSSGVLDTEWVYDLTIEGRREKLASLTGLLKGIYTPDNDPELNISDTPLVSSGIFVAKEDLMSEPSNQALIVPDFADYLDPDKERWLKDVSSSLDNLGIAYLIADYDSAYASPDEFYELKTKVASSQYLITPRSYLYYLARGWGGNAIVYDVDNYVSLSFDRELRPPAALIRHKRDFSRLFENQDSQFDDSKLDVTYNASGTLQEFGGCTSLQITKSHIVLWGRMPPHNYSGGRYHGWLLAEGFAALGYQVTVMTDNRPYFIDDFSHMPGHRNIHVKTTSNFLDPTSYPSYTAENIIVIPGMDKNGDMYKGAIDYATNCGARLGLVNFESPNWFNSMVFPNRDPELWKYWEVTSKFSSLILSTTDVSRGYAQEYYLNSRDSCLFESLYAPINSTYAERYCELKNKEKRVIVFFPRHGYSAHKGWQNIVDTLGDGFKNHTVVFLCGESDLPKDVIGLLNNLATEIGFEIEYKIKINDQEKFEELARACLLLFPSQFEGYGYPPIEALAVGTPTVAFDLPVLRETCEEHLIYAPNGDWESFKHLANKALATNYRLQPEAVERALYVASFTRFTERLSSITDKWIDVKNAELKACSEDITKAFFDLNSLVSKFIGQRSKNIESKAIIKELLYGVGFDPKTDIRINSASRVLITVQNTSVIDVELGSNTLLDLIVHLNKKGIGVDVLSQDFAIETFAQRFKFSLNRFISIGKSELNAPQVRGEVGILLLKMLHQYSYFEIICVDEFLYPELIEIANVSVCPQVASLDLTRKVRTSNKIFSRNYVGELEGGTGDSTFIVPNSLLVSRDRKAWLVNGPNQLVTIVVDNFCTKTIRLLANFEQVMQSLQKQGLSIDVRLASKSPMTSLPYFASSVIYQNNDDLYKFMRQSMFSVNLLEGQLESYLSTMNRLVGVIELSSELSSRELEAIIVKLSSDSEVWKKVRRTAFNDEINKAASLNYYRGVLTNTGSKDANLMNKFEAGKKTFIQDFEKLQPRLFLQFKEKLNLGLIAQACEILKRYTLTSEDDVVAKALLIKLSLLAGMPSFAEALNRELIAKYPVESLVYSLGAKVKQYLNQTASASQYDYFGLMLDSTSIETILCASQSSIKAGRSIDIEIHTTIVQNVASFQLDENLEGFNCERQSHLYKALIEEYANNGTY
ncbi:hypothetical protein ALTERO38_80018 [Alteromonas sp. 38]|uniref:glycosyltransferase n=1 Tax=unclassified Alteromonas TaxID=2614992 RepID=UPI0012EF3958|nr:MULTISPECIES: glycosyltransferase [unclassified Alteromonas]CAD5250204.1 hypothetical protein ALTER154_10591 [Alteromonas sp. 154]VXC39118.1 hypothetical protein ALTERO38_80018 [Alteromonas sp. 38]